MARVDDRSFSGAIDLSFSAATQYLPIAEHGVVGDLRTVALVGTDGTIDWYCCPRFDSPSVFGAILDRKQGGRYRISPTVGVGTVKQLYFPDTNVLITRFLTPVGVGELQDFMPVGQRQRLVRRVLCVRGEMSFRVEVDPRFDYGREPHDAVVHEHGVVFKTPSLTLALASGIGFRVGEDGVLGEFSLRPGESESFVLETVAESHIPHAFTPEETLRDFEETVQFWRRWLSQSRYRGRWRETVHRSALVLKLLTYQPSGAMVASPTTSLPEQIGGGRNWDYRYTWIRDTAFSLYALLRLGFSDEAAGFMDWLTDRFRERVGHESGPLQIMYAVDGSSELAEEVLDHFEGYRGSGPVRIGNGAANQLQLDISGELIDSV
jgi:GH15 family glucan-1,4-alpha-glucosidase